MVAHYFPLFLSKLKRYFIKMESTYDSIKWSLCVLCQEKTSEVLKCPANSKHTADIAKVYANTVSLLKRFNESGNIPNKFHQRNASFISTGSDVEKLFLEKKVSWHHSCKSLITESKLTKLSSKRKSEGEVGAVPVLKKITRSQIPKFDPNTCFVPGCSIETSEDEQLHEVMSKELDERFRSYAMTMNDSELLTKLAPGDLIALEAKYHSTCVLAYFNRVRSKLRQSRPSTIAEQVQKFESQALLKLVSEMEVHRYDADAAPFVMSELVDQYDKLVIEILPNNLPQPTTHSTRLKNKLLSQIPDLQYFKKGKTGYMAFNSKITELLHDEIGRNRNQEIQTLLEANRILRKNMFNENHHFGGSLREPTA